MHSFDLRSGGQVMDDKLVDADCGKLCPRCQESQSLELQARRIILNGELSSSGGGHKHCGHHVNVIGLRSSSKRPRLRIGRYVRSDSTRAVLNGHKGPDRGEDAAAIEKLVENLGNLNEAKASWVEAQAKPNEEEDSSLIPGLGDDVARLCLARLARTYYGSYYTVSKQFYSLLSNGDLYKTRRSLGICEQWVYMLMSGQSIWRAFSPIDGGRWRELPPTPADVCFSMADKESLTAGTELLVVGREVAGPVIWRYDLVKDKWEKASHMITPRCLYASASAGVHAFVAGGVATSTHAGSSQLDPFRAAERYDSLTRQWEALPDMNKARRMCSGVFMDGKFYVIGGTDGKGDLMCGEEYDPETRSWRVIPNMAPRRSSSTDHAPPLVAVVDNQLYSLDTSARQLKLYCKSSNTWTVIADGDVPVKADMSNGWGVAFKALDGELLLINGDALYAWKPAPGPVQWRYVAGLAESFVFNCAVMSA